MIWKDIKRYEGIYQISEFGDIKSLRLTSKRLLKQGLVDITYKEKIMRSNKITDKTRYKMIALSKKDGNNTLESFSIHRLVFEAFCGDISDGLVIDHIDGNRGNNHYSNLRQITQKDNAISYFEKKQNSLFLGDRKKCSSCDNIKGLCEFYLKPKNQIYNWTIDKWRSKCKKCSNKK